MQLEQQQQVQQLELLQLEQRQEQQLVPTLLVLVRRLALEQEQQLLLSYRKQPRQ